MRLAPWLFLFALVCFVPTQAAGQEIVTGADMHYARGVSWSEKQRWYLAIAEFTKAIELNPSNAFAYNGRGKAYYHKGQYDQAIADYGKAIELKPDFYPFLKNKDHAYEAKSGGKASVWFSKTFDEYFEKVGKEGSNPQPPPESTQPWQTSWAAFCDELQRLYKRGASDDEMDALFAGKTVTWEGPAMQIDRSTSTIGVAMQCQVTRADHRSADTTITVVLRFESSAEIPNDLKEPARVRFSTRLAEPEKFPNGKTAFLTRPVFWATWRKEGQEPIERVMVNTSDDTKLLEYVKIGDHPAEKFIENYDRDPEGTSKKIDKFIEDHKRNPEEADKQLEELMNELFK